MNALSNSSNISSFNLTEQPIQLFSDQLILAYNVFLSLIIAFGATGNLLVLIVFVKMKVSTSTDWFIIFITILDLISSIVNVPVYLTFTNGMWRHYGTEMLCKLHMYFSQTVVVSSALMTTGLAIERYLKVCRPYSVKMSRRKARNICLTFCIIAAMASIPSAQIHHNKHGHCTTGLLSSLSMGYFFAVFVFFIAVFITVSFCYISISFMIKRSEKRIRGNGQLSLVPTSSRSYSGQRRSIFVLNKVFPSEQSSNKGISRSRESSTDPYKKESTADQISGNDSDWKTTTKPVKAQNVNKVCKTFVWTTSLQVPPREQPTSSAGTHASSQLTATTSISGEARGKNRLYKDNEATRSKTQTTKIAFLVCTIFIASWVIPWVCFVLLQTNTGMPLLRFTLFGRMTYLVNTFTNPFLYALLNLKFRQKLKACFRFVTIRL